MATAYRYFVHVNSTSEIATLLKHFQLQLPCGSGAADFIAVRNNIVTGKGSPDLEYELHAKIPPDAMHTIITNAFVFSATKCFPIFDDFVFDIDMKTFGVRKIVNGIDWSRTVSEVALHTDVIEEVEFREYSRISDTRQIRLTGHEYFIPVERLYLENDFQLMVCRQVLIKAWNNIRHPKY